MTVLRVLGCAVLVGTSWLMAQEIPQPEDSAHEAPVDKRVFGVFPNYRTADGQVPFERITARQKMSIAAKDSFDWPVFPTAAAFAALYQLEDQNPSFGQGMAGYGKRYAGAYGDQMIGNLLVEGVMPSLYREDPRYFRLGSGSVGHRLWYASTRVFVTRRDSGRNSFNFSEVTGNTAEVALSNAWYPDTRSASDAAQRLAISIATDSFSNVMKEFWPDVKKRLFRRHDTDGVVIRQQAQSVN